VAGVGASLGLVLGGIVTDWVSWRVGFFINVPIGIAMMLAAPRFLPETARRAGRFELLGALSSTLGMTALVYGIVRSATAGWSDLLTVVALAAGVVLLGLFVLNEWRVEQPTMPLRLVASKERAGAYAGRILFLGAMLGFWFFGTQVPAERQRLRPAGGRDRLPADDGGQLRGGHRGPAADPAVRQRPAARHRGGGHPDRHGLAQPARGRHLLPHRHRAADGSDRHRPGRRRARPGHRRRHRRRPPDDAGAASGLVNVAHQLGGSLGAALTAGAVLLALALVVVTALVVGRRSGRPSPEKLA